MDNEDEELSSLSVEDIMRDTHLKREVAQVLYDSFGDTLDYTTYTGEDFDGCSSLSWRNKKVIISS